MRIWTAGVHSVTFRKETLGQYITGWVNYFKLADMRKLFLRVDEWYRRRIRIVIWKQWKRIRTKLMNLTKLGVKKSKAWEWANTRKGYCYIANCFILKSTFTADRLRQHIDDICSITFSFFYSPAVYLCSPIFCIFPCVLPLHLE
ncbi:MAG: group II intron maturase-specific domain-containing protein [Candidatus Cyclobacteriaceae bacterium M3_2C_046]